MKTSIEIKVECKGDAVGTLGWLNSMLEKSEMVIKNTKNGLPAIFLKTEKPDGTFEYRFLCKKATYNMEDGYKVTSDGYACEIPEGNYEISGFANHPLTPACRKAVEELIMKAKEVFAEWWENDGN